MNPEEYILTPNDLDEIIVSKNEYKVKHLSDYITITIENANDNIIIRSNYYELKLNIENLAILTKTIYKSIDEVYEFINNIFIQNKFKIKEINSQMISIIIIIYDNIKGNEKEIELLLKENFDDKNYLIKDLFNKYMKVEKEIIEERYNNKKLNEDNDKLKQENMNIKTEIESIKNNYNNNIGDIKMNIMNITNQIYQLQQQLNEFIFQINQMQQQLNLISMNINNPMMNLNNFSLMNPQNSFNQINQNDFNLINQNNNSMNFNNNIMGMPNPLFKIMNPVNEANKPKNVIFRLKFTEYLYYSNIFIEFHNKDLVSTLIDKFKNKLADFYSFEEDNDDIRFIFNANSLQKQLTAEEAGIKDNSNIFVVFVKKANIKITFKISSSKIDESIIEVPNILKVSGIIKIYLNFSGLNRNEIIGFYYNSKILNEDKSLKEEGIEKDSVIYIKIKNLLNLKTISLFIKYYDDDSKEYKYPLKLECLITEKIESIIETYGNKFGIDAFLAFLNSENLDRKKRIEETKISDNSTIIIKKLNF